MVSRATIRQRSLVPWQSKAATYNAKSQASSHRILEGPGSGQWPDRNDRHGMAWSSFRTERYSEEFYARMLSLVDGSRDVDLCGVEGTKRSTQCYGFEFLWHVACFSDRHAGVTSLTHHRPCRPLTKLVIVSGLWRGGGPPQP